MIRISLKAPEYRTTNNIICYTYMESGKQGDARYLYIDGPCKSVYEIDPQIAPNRRIFWLETESKIYRNDEPFNGVFRKIILIDKHAIQNNCGFQQRKEFDKFHKVCSLIEDGKTISTALNFEISGPSKIIYEPENKDYKVWIETNSDVKMINDVTGE